MRKSLFLFMTVCCFLMSAPSAYDVAGYPADDTTTVYKTASGLAMKLNIYYPPGHTPDDRRAAILFFFGGGWNSGSVTHFAAHADTMAKLGMVAMTPDYRTKNGEGAEPWQCVEDAKSAIRYVRIHAEEFGIDSGRIAASGGSAGGHLAAALATISGFNAPDEDSTINAHPIALVLYNPVYDNGPDGYGYDRVQDYYLDFSPIHNIDSTHPPTIHFWGSEDNLAPKPTDKYDSILQAHGVVSRIHIYEGQAHGFFNYRENNDPGYENTLENENPYYDSTIDLSIKFLDSLGLFEQAVSIKMVPGRDGRAGRAGVAFPISGSPFIFKVPGKEAELFNLAGQVITGRPEIRGNAARNRQ